MKSIKIYNKMLLLLIFVIIIFWICYIGFVYSYALINDVANSCFNAVGLVALYLIMPFVAITYIVCLIFGGKTGEGKAKRKKALSALCFAFIMAAHVFLRIYALSVTPLLDKIRITDITSKTMEDGKYYFTLLDKYSKNTVKIECPESSYNQIIVDKMVEYIINFRTIDNNSKKGYLVFVDTINYSDNRGRQVIED